MKSRLSRISILARALASPTLFLLAKALRSQRMSERPVRMDQMNLCAVASLAPCRQLEIENFIIAAHLTVVVDEGSKNLVSTFFSRAKSKG